MKCYNCKSEIDDDSLYCDQCGCEIYLCPSCGTPGKGMGKRCGRCGTPLVRAGKSAVDTSLPTRLVCRAENITLDLQDGALLGRIEGPYTSQLGRLQFVSSRHARLTRGDDHWIIADVGSRNGTAVNGEWCFIPLPFRKGDVVRIANYYDFVAE